MIDREHHLLQTAKGPVQYERLILATGSVPTKPGIPGVETPGVFTILKDVDYLEGLQRSLQKAKDVVIIGGGFIGIEFADEINKIDGKSVTVVELAANCLSLSYDAEFCTEMEERLRSRGVVVRTVARVERITGNGHVTGVELKDGTRLAADVVILGIGARANVDLAKAAGLRLGLTGSIAVDRTMQTSDPAIFACGDCAEKISFFGGGPSPLKLASIAQLEARIAGCLLYTSPSPRDRTRSRMPSSA